MKLSENFKCDVCKTAITVTQFGQLNECEHHPLDPMPEKQPNKRTSFLELLAEFTRTENCVTRSVLRDILKNRLNDNDIS